MHSWQKGFEHADLSVRGCISLYGVYDWTSRSVDALSADHRRRPSLPYSTRRMIAEVLVPDVFQRPYLQQEYEQASPLFNIKASAPPLFCLQGSLDCFVNPKIAQYFIEHCQKAGTQQTTYALLSGAHHFFDSVPTIRNFVVIQALIQFLETTQTT
jgi:dipeptidyl aminopeptidase/acylaminoacyl peptidase